MDDANGLAERFEQYRPRLRSLAYRMLGSLAEAEDAVQDSWLRLSQSDATQIDNLGGWLTTVVTRECLHLLRARRHRRESPFADHLPDPVITPDGGLDPEQQALLADSVGLALLVVLDSLTPAERLAFVLHDMFQLPFDEIALVAGRTPAAARQLASRARRRVADATLPVPDADRARQRRVVDAFFAAANAGDFAALLDVLDPDVVIRADVHPDRPLLTLRGVRAVAKFARPPRGELALQPVLVNGVVGAVVVLDGQPTSVLAFTVVNGKIVEITGLRDPVRVRRLAASVVGLLN